MPTLSKSELRKMEVDDVRKFMSDVSGRRFMYRLLAKSGLYQSVFRDRPLLTPEQRPIFNGAQRDFGQWLHDELGLCAPVEFDRMMAEERERKLVARMDAANSKEEPKEESDEAVS